MVKFADKIIYIQNLDGECAPFDPMALQTRLINCFLTAGLRESSYLSEDIALAVEYTLLLQLLIRFSLAINLNLGKY